MSLEAQQQVRVRLLIMLMRQLRCNDSTQAEWDAVLQKMCERPGNLVSTRTAPHAL